MAEGSRRADKWFRPWNGGRCSISGAKRWGQKSERERKAGKLLRSGHPCAEFSFRKEEGDSSVGTRGSRVKDMRNLS